MHRLALAALTLVLVSAPAAAYADSITTANFSTGAFSTSTNQTNNLSVMGFNPALGTLDSVTLAFSGSYILTGANSVFGSIADLDLYVPFVISADQLDPQSSNGTHRASATATASFSGALAYFSSTGNVNVDFSVSEEGSGTVSNAIPNGFAGTVTYDYTPAAPVAVTPEPSSLALLGTGILGVAGVLRKRLA